MATWGVYPFSDNPYHGISRLKSVEKVSTKGLNMSIQFVTECPVLGSPPHISSFIHDKPFWHRRNIYFSEKHPAGNANTCKHIEHLAFSGSDRKYMEIHLM
jgi:hypothetical protein